MTRIDLALNTDRGRRRGENEDSVLVRSWKRSAESPDSLHLLAVADGMGGAAGGATASSETVGVLGEAMDGIGDQDAGRALEAAFQSAHNRLLEIGRQKPELEDMGSTLVAAVIEGTNLRVANIGDSRAYLVRAGTARQITKDHSWVAEQVRAGSMTETEAATNPDRNVITRCIGLDTGFAVDVFPEIELEAGDIVVLCSDGLTGVVSDQEIAEICSKESASQAANRLVRLANRRGGPDNISVVIGQVDPPRRPFSLIPSSLLAGRRGVLAALIGVVASVTIVGALVVGLDALSGDSESAVLTPHITDLDCGNPSPAAPAEVSCTVEADGPVDTIVWSAEGGTPPGQDTGFNFFHTRFESPREYEVVVTVCKGLMACDTGTKTISVSPPDSAPLYCPSDVATGEEFDCWLEEDSDLYDFYDVVWSAPEGTILGAMDGTTLLASFDESGRSSVEVTFFCSPGCEGQQTKKSDIEIHDPPSISPIVCDPEVIETNESVTCSVKVNPSGSPMWAAPLGDPDRGIGLEFTTSFGSPGEQTIEVKACNGPACASVPRKIVVTAPATGSGASNEQTNDPSPTASAPSASASAQTPTPTESPPIDSDGDGVPDEDDHCETPKIFPRPIDANGCRVDIDLDGACNDQAAKDARPDHCGQKDIDSCPGTKYGVVTDDVGCSDEQVDRDGDGYCDPDALSTGPSSCQLEPPDNCPDFHNPDGQEGDDCPQAGVAHHQSNEQEVV